MLRDNLMGQVRGFLHDLPTAAGAISARRLAPGLELEVVIRRGLPDRED